MKVLLVNGSPNKNGCTFTALSEVAVQLEKDGVGAEILYLGKQPINDCVDCGFCFKNGKCVFGDIVNETAARLGEFDGFVFGAPGYYAGPSARLLAFMDRLFYSAGGKLAYKPAAAIVSCRRGGSTASFDRINKYFTINNMPVVSSQYWNQVHGNTPEEVLKDEEGMQTMRRLGRNMAWLLKCIGCGRSNGVNMPDAETVVRTNFIR